METARHLWRVLFIIMDVILLGVLPLALLKDLCCQKRKKKKSHMKSKILGIFACACFMIIFLVDAFIFNNYIGNSNATTTTDNSSED